MPAACPACFSTSAPPCLTVDDDRAVVGVAVGSACPWAAAASRAPPLAAYPRVHTERAPPSPPRFCERGRACCCRAAAPVPGRRHHHHHQGEGGEYGVSLTSKPTAPVKVVMFSNCSQLVAVPNTLVFTPGNWSNTVFVLAQAIKDGVNQVSAENEAGGVAAWVRAWA